MNSFATSVRTLASGTASAQVLTLLAAPIMARIYTPQEYGAFALWSMVVVVFALIGGGKYDAAILIPPDEVSARALVYLSLCTTLASAFLLVLAALWGGGALAASMGVPELTPWIPLLAPVILSANLTLSLGAWTNRHQAYNRLAVCRVIQAVVQVAMNIGLAGFGVLGLITGILVGQCVGTGVLEWCFWRRDHLGDPRVAWSDLRRVASAYVAFPKYTLGADLLNHLSNQWVTLILPKFFGVPVLGGYSLGQRVIAVPSNVVGTAIGDVFRSRASRDFETDGNCQKTYRQTVSYLVLAGAVPFGALMVAAPALFAWVFGESWRAAGEITRVMALMNFVRFVASPLAFTFFLAGRQYEDLVLQGWIVVSSPIVLWLGYRYSGEVTTT